MSRALLRPADLLAVMAIRVYQRFISPHKAFCCAHRELHGRESCSQYVPESIKRFGLASGLCLMRKRLMQCREAAVLMAKVKRQRALRVDGYPKYGPCDNIGPVSPTPCDCGSGSCDMFDGMIGGT